MGLFNIFNKKKASITDLDKQRRDHLSENGRITEGTILERNTEEAGEIAYYIYNVHGVDYESSDYLDTYQQSDPLKYAPGAKVSIRFDPKQHGSSMLI